MLADLHLWTEYCFQEGVESAKEMIPSLARFTEHQLLGFLDVLQQLQSPSYMSN
jgi:hypothetical protein